MARVDILPWHLTSVQSFCWSASIFSKSALVKWGTAATASARCRPTAVLPFCLPACGSKREEGQEGW